MSERIRHWSGAISYGMLEQILLSGGSFAFTALMAHTLGAREFGWFSIAWATMLFLEAGGWGLFGDGAPAARETLPASFHPQFRGAFLLLSTGYASLVLCIGIAVALALAMVDRSHGLLAFATVIASFCLRIQNATRRLYYLDALRKEAALAALFNVAILGGVALATLAGWWRPAGWEAMMMVGLANLASASTYILWRRRISTCWPSARLRSWAMARLWHVGKWLLASSSMSWLGNFGMVIWVGYFVTVEASGTLRAILALMTPAAQMNLVLMSLIVPRAAASLRRDRDSGIWPIALKAMAVIGTLTLSYAVLATIGGGWLATALFGETGRDISRLTIAIATFGFALESIRYGCNTVLYASKRTRILGYGQATALISSILLVFIASHYGFDAIILAITASNNLNTLIIFVYFLFTFRSALPIGKAAAKG